MRTRNVAFLIAIAVVCAGHVRTQAQRAPAFDAGDPSTYPPGTRGCAAACTSGTITLPLPANGVLTFSRFTADGAFTITFAPNAANTPVTIRVSDDVVL